MMIRVHISWPITVTSLSTRRIIKPPPAGQRAQITNSKPEPTGRHRSAKCNAKGKQHRIQRTNIELRRNSVEIQRNNMHSDEAQTATSRNQRLILAILALTNQPYIESH